MSQAANEMMIGNSKGCLGRDCLFASRNASSIIPQFGQVRHARSGWNLQRAAVNGQGVNRISKPLMTHINNSHLTGPFSRVVFP